MPEKRRYWVYANDDVAGELTEDIGDMDKLIDAIDSATHYLINLYPQTQGVTVRVVDNTTQATVWIAGPGNSIVEAKTDA